MSNHTHISVNLQCPQDLWQAIQRKADSLNKDPITVMIDTLDRAFGLNLPPENLATTQEISQLKTRLNAIEQAIKPLLIDPYLRQKLVDLASQNSTSFSPENRGDRDVISLVSEIDIYSASVKSLTDDIEDEPDEILYDFLPG